MQSTQLSPDVREWTWLGSSIGHTQEGAPRRLADSVCFPLLQFLLTWGLKVRVSLCINRNSSIPFPGLVKTTERDRQMKYPEQHAAAAIVSQNFHIEQTTYRCFVKIEFQLNNE